MYPNYHAEARKTIYFSIAGGVIAAFLLSPIPCASSPILMGIEIYMLFKIVRLYNYELDPQTKLIIFGLLLGISVILSLIVGDVIAILTAMVLAPIVKPLVAGLVIWGLGEGAIYILDHHGE